MTKYLVTATYTPQGLKGLAAEGGSGRKAALEKALQAIGGKLQAIYFSQGETHVVMIADVPDAVSMMALGLAAGASGTVASTTSTPLLTVEDVDAACHKIIAFRPAGAAEV